MLRLVSVIGIAIAMVIGFVALSTQMRVEFFVRQQVSTVANYMKHIANQELQCDAGIRVPGLPGAVSPANNDTTGDQSASNVDSTMAAAAEDDVSTGDSGQSTAVEPAQPKIVSAVNYTTSDNGVMEVIAQFTDVKGESGKLRIKAGRILKLSCHCAGKQDPHVTCETVASDINKNYVPGKIKVKPKT
jgi:hypothetical protein